MDWLSDGTVGIARVKGKDQGGCKICDCGMHSSSNAEAEDDFANVDLSHRYENFRDKKSKLGNLMKLIIIGFIFQI